MTNYSTFYLLISTINPPTFAVPSFSYWHNTDGSVWFVYILVMVDCYRIKLIIYWSCYQSYRSDFYRSDWSSRQFTLFINCMLESLTLLLKLAIVLNNLTFIDLICPQGNLPYLWITYLVLPFIWALIQSWLLDHIVTSLDLSTILWLRTIKKNRLLIDDKYRSFDIDVLKIGLTASSQSSFYCFTHDSFGNKG